MKTKILIMGLLLSTTIGCGTLKEATGEYVTEAVKDDIVRRVDELLDKRKLSLDEFTEATDANNDGQLTRDEVYGTVKDMTRDYVMLEAKSYVDSKLNDSNSATKGDVESASQQFWQWLLGLISLYLGKQLYSQKGDNKRDQKIALLEKMMQKDLDGDGHIGLNGDPVPDPAPEPVTA